VLKTQGMKAEILEKLAALLEQEDVFTIQKEFKQLSSQFRQMSAVAHSEDTFDADSDEDDQDHSEEHAELPNVTSAAPAEGHETAPALENQESDVSEAGQADLIGQEDDLFKELQARFKEKLEAAKVRKQKIEEETIQTAKDLIEELTSLVTHEENIGKAFSGYNAIKDKWRELPKVSNDAYRDLNAEYNKQVERFFYNINIYKELKELDLKHNLEQKLLVLEDQKKLLEENDIRLLEVEVRLNQDRWNEIGPTFKDNWDAIKDEFWGITRSIYKKIQDFYNIRREEQTRNLELKKEILEKAKAIASLDLKAHKKWQEKSAEIIEIQKEWKMVGFVPKEQAGPLWKEFRKVCDGFFEKKRAHYEELKKIQDANKALKLKLVELAESLKDSEDWKETATKLTSLQKEWKQIGAAHQRDENKLWNRFREACDAFFEARKGSHQQENKEQSENLSAKQALIQEIQHFTEKDRKLVLEKLKDFSERWRQIGHVPFKEKDSINEAYRKAIDTHYDGLDIDKKQKEKIRFEQKIEDFKDADHGDKLLRKEQDILLNKIAKLQSEIIQFDNNMGFFASSKGADKFKQEIQKKIEKNKAEIDELKERISILRNA
jgi:predicted XRE-type DNA-binding protein